MLMKMIMSPVVMKIAILKMICFMKNNINESLYSCAHLALLRHESVHKIVHSSVYRCLCWSCRWWFVNVVTLTNKKLMLSVYGVDGGVIMVQLNCLNSAVISTMYEIIFEVWLISSTPEICQTYLNFVGVILSP